MANTARLENETFDGYKIRLCDNREEYNLTWPDVGALLGMNHDTVRKWWTSFSDGVRHAIETNATTNSEIKTLEEKRIRLELERKKVQTEKVEWNKILREQARRELLFEQVKDAIGRVEPPVFNELPLNIGKRGAILGIADLHYGKKFKSLSNEFSVGILRQRMEQLLSETAAICKRENIDVLNVLNAGDNIDGLLRISQLQALQMGTVDSTIEFSRFMVEWLNELSKHVIVHYHHVKSANHPEIRPLGTSAGQFPKEDMERIMHMYIHDMLSNNSRIHVSDSGDSPHVLFDMCGYTVFGTHGHTFKGKSVDNVIKDVSMMHRKFVDYVICGHLHHGKEVSVYEGDTNNREVLQLPSVMGSDEFSDSLFTGSKPGAKLYIFEQNKGKSIGYDIRL